jgi:hypothetical protein
VETFETLAVTRFIARHFVHRIVDGIVVALFRELGNLCLARARAMLCLNPQFKILLGAGCDDFAQKLGELGGVLGFLKGSPMIEFGDFGITLADGHAAHRKVHAYFRTFAVKMRLEIRFEVAFDVRGNTHDVFSRKRGIAYRLGEL